jgi:hypothetical protein
MKKTIILSVLTAFISLSLFAQDEPKQDKMEKKESTKGGKKHTGKKHAKGKNKSKKKDAGTGFCFYTRLWLIGQGFELPRKQASPAQRRQECRIPFLL